jgi:Sec-independent protein translocase protein TatA
MKNVTIGILLLAAVVFGSLYLSQNRKAGEAQATIGNLRQNVADLESRLAEQEKRSASLQTRLHDTRAKAVAKADEVAHLEQVLTNSPQTNAKAANPFAEMFKSPEMKELIKTQQKAVFSGMIDKNYAAFSTGMQLTPEQSASLKELVVKKSLVDAGMAMSMMSGDVDASKRKEVMQQAKADKEAIDGEIKQFLGEDNYPQFQAYEKTMPERMAISSFKDMQATGAGALNPDQESQLVQAMTETRQNFKFMTDFYDHSKYDADPAAVFTEEKLSQFQQEREQLDQQYLARAKGILSEDQLGSFQKFLVSQRELQNAGMKMGMKMFGAKTEGK